MDLHDILTNAAYLIVVLLAAGGAYLRRPPKPPSNSVMAGVGFGLMEHSQAERLIAAVEKIALILSDEKQSAIEDRLEELVEKLDGMKAIPPRRR